MKKNIIIAMAAMAATVFSAETMAQETAAATTAQSDWSFTAGADLVSSYVWRGLHCGGASFQPSATVAYKGLSLGVWGSTDFDNAANEFDLALSFASGGFSATLTDYFFPENGVVLQGEGRRGGYFTWEKEKTGHQLELGVAYDFSEKGDLPLALSWNTYLAGADLKEDGDRQFSSYFDVTFSPKVGEVGLDITAGFTPWAGAYQNGEKLNMVNLSVKGSYDIKFTESFSLPVFVEAIVNPNTENAYIVVGISF